MKKSEKLLLLFLQAAQTEDNQIKRKDNVFMFKPSFADWALLKRFSLLKQDSTLTSFGSIYEPMVEVKTLNNKAIDKTLVNALSELSERIVEGKVSEISQNLLNELETLQLILESRVPVSEEKIEEFFTNEISEGATAPVEVPEVEVKKKTRKKV